MDRLLASDEFSAMEFLLTGMEFHPVNWPGSRH